ncbi:MAG: acyl-CoA dehydrogenase family protein [Desulfobacteraceae bacterium]|nr:acyl-CoA dehydrogenase family protein [Desulfobacteraceae bacterium]
MSNFFRDNPDILFHMEHLDFSRIVELKEDGFADRDRFPEAPTDLEDAVDNYRRVLDIVGDIAGGYVAPRAEQVDRTGARFADGVVTYAPGTREALERLRQAEVMGFTLPRRYGGLNMPKTVYSIAIEMISRADASLMNIFGLQEIADTINKFGSEEQKQRYLPRFCEGSVMGSMALTEPDAGSDLQSVRLRSHQDEDGIWHLNGVKRFITNGCADISLVMARSEEGTTGGRGISLFIYERDEHMRIRRIEEKLGIHGSPTCELQFDDAPAELLGRRKMGLVKYTMSLMNGARLGVAAQAVGIAEAACREATRYARDRTQFKKPIHQFAAVYEMLTCMQVDIEAARTLLYETSRIVDIKEGLEEKAERHPESARDIAGAVKRYTKLAGVLTPMVKAYASEVANRICYDAIQVHAGVGFTCDFPVERLYRDVRITNIYEGTTQLQVVAAIGTVLGGGISELLSAYEEEYDFSPVSERFAQAEQLRRDLEAAVSAVKQAGDPAFQEYHSRRIVETAIDAVTGYRLCIDALYSERKRKVAALFLARAVHRCRTRLEIILSGDRNCMDFHPEIIAGFPE